MPDSTPTEATFPDHVDAELYIDDFAELIRDLLRAVAADDNAGALTSAASRLRGLIQYSDRLPIKLSWYKILSAAVDRLKPKHVPFDAPRAGEHDYDRLAAYGVKLAAELTTSDNLSTARINKARRNMADEIRSIDSTRELRRELRKTN